LYDKDREPTEIAAEVRRSIEAHGERFTGFENADDWGTQRQPVYRSVGYYSLHVTRSRVVRVADGI